MNEELEKMLKQRCSKTEPSIQSWLEKIRDVLVILVIMLFGIFLAILVTGCVSAKMEFPDGRVFTYNRYFTDQKVEGFLLEPDGGVIIEGQESSMKNLTDTINKLADKLP